MVLHIKLSELKSKYNKTDLHHQIHHQILHLHQNFEKMKSYNERKERNSIDIMR